MRQFILNGQLFNEGDVLSITTAEFGTITASTAVQPFSHDQVVGLELSPTTLVPSCKAKWSMYSNGQAYHTLQLAYHCNCAHNVHRRSLQWFELTITGNAVLASEARPVKPLPPLAIPYRNILKAEEPEPQPPILEEPVEEVKANRHGQIQLF